jgi:glycosyltransferase involved in cell wall biosynthesis
MTRVCIGVHVHAEPDRLRATLDRLRAGTARPFDLLVLPDAPDAPTAAALATLGVPQRPASEPLGPAACLNHMLAATDHEVVVLLESGSLVGPGWLDHLLDALAADPRNGLAGPSTNLAWNEQCVFPRCGGSTEEIERTAHEARARFGATTRTLEPLYSLADFCYAVRREVYQKIGPADEGYGLGPCWEMDYNVRAARAGFRGVWACASFVYRSPFTTRRRDEEARRFDASRRRYQDRFCGARLRGERAFYRSHCRGDACPNFAPPSLIQLDASAARVTTEHALREPVASQGAARLAIRALPEQKECIDCLPRTEVGHSQPMAPSAAAAAPSDHDVAQSGPSGVPPPELLASVLMPTYNRRALVPLAIQGFLRQDYSRLELVIVDDGDDPVADLLPADPRIRYVRVESRLSIGCKRNLACSRARGEVLVHWDDDDWYPSWRVSAQVRALIDHRAEVCGSSRVLYFEPGSGRAWRYEYRDRNPPWLAGNTLAYRRGAWQRHPFPDVQIGEDALFLWSDRSRPMYDLADPALCVAAIHEGNTSPKATTGVYWSPEPAEHIRELLGDDLSAWCAAFSGAGGGTAPADAPLISCILPTHDRRPFVALAVRSFLDQDYPRKELVVIDDGKEPVGDLVEGLPGVHYARLNTRTTIGAKRNLACRLAGGEIVAHWDDDDWYAPSRLRYQAAPIRAGLADLSGLVGSFVLELPDGSFWCVAPGLHRRMFVGDVHGGTLMFRRALLGPGLAYPELNLAEDAWLIHQAQARGGRLARLTNPGVFVYVRHGRNAWTFESGRFLDPDGWTHIEPPDFFPAADLAAYRAAASAARTPYDSLAQTPGPLSR